MTVKLPLCKRIEHRCRRNMKWVSRSAHTAQKGRSTYRSVSMRMLAMLQANGTKKTETTVMQADGTKKRVLQPPLRRPTGWTHNNGLADFHESSRLSREKYINA
jgi:hypothetical protein